ncbi:glycosyltransferase family 9 protein [Cognaticolwellia beringensis]|uniref:ADP-heptose--LPS heptosyltransferase I n=1 Tax=Cognaticolwellia beringensis TaxID=1967665 RepID=A0A222G770_9GAMM|nr:glycosyltransferase family 9 protein [Cognaticolwellia beringensis]ASP47582.1 ADP-heptose--LPS heptosyltransferase I [Cognaticolwellia beringensis]
MLGQISAPKNLCLLRLSAIGDVCHAVAVVQNIQRQWPDTKITWVIGKIEASLLQGLYGVEFVIFDKRAGLKGYQDLRQNLKGRKFDVLLHMQVALRASIASLCISAKVKIGFDTQRAKEGQWLFTNKKIAKQKQPHVLDGFMGFAKALGLDAPPPLWKMPLADSDQLWASEKLSAANEANKPIAVLCPAASKAERNWHAEGYSQTAEYLIARGFKVVVCGGPTTMEKLLAEAIISRSKLNQSENEIQNLVGKTSLKQLLAVLKLAHLVVAPDTGPAHMAVTVETPVVGLYAHSNPKRTGPYLYAQYVVSAYTSSIQRQYKQSFEQLPWGTRAKGKDLMMQISIADVRKTIERLIHDNYPELG